MDLRNGSIEAYRRALEIDPGNGDAWFRRGNALRQLGRYNESIQDLDRALEIDPFNAYAWQSKGWALENLWEYNRSEEALARSLEINFMDAEAWTTKGDALRGLGLYKESDYAYNEAVAIYDKITNIDSGDADVWRKKGEVLLALRKYGESLDAFERVFNIYYIDENQPDVEILYNKQKAYFILYIYRSDYYHGRTYNLSELSLELKASCENALDIYNEKISSNPNNADAWRKKAEIFSDLRA
jgi:tetratricopeptide (TPR) repeat protein